MDLSAQTNPPNKNSNISYNNFSQLPVFLYKLVESFNNPIDCKPHLVAPPMSDKESKVIWLTCPDCGSKIGIILSVGKSTNVAKHVEAEKEEETESWPPSSFEEKLKTAGIDISLLNIEDGEEAILVSPKKFLGDLWGPINDTMRSLGGSWIREGRDSRWEIRKKTEQ